MNLLLKHIKWHSKVKIIFLAKLALIDITSAFESWASAPQLAVAPTVLQPGFCWSSYPEGWVADQSLRHLPSLFSPEKVSGSFPCTRNPQRQRNCLWPLYDSWYFPLHFPYHQRKKLRPKKPSPLTAQIKNGIREEKRKQGTESPRREMGTIPKVCFYAFLPALLRTQWVKGRLPSPSKK